jgi:hypothetical protein
MCRVVQVPRLVSFVIPLLEVSSIEKFGGNDSSESDANEGLIVCTKAKVGGANTG